MIRLFFSIGSIVTMNLKFRPGAATCPATRRARHHPTGPAVNNTNRRTQPEPGDVTMAHDSNAGAARPFIPHDEDKDRLTAHPPTNSPGPVALNGTDDPSGAEAGELEALQQTMQGGASLAPMQTGQGEPSLGGAPAGEEVAHLKISSSSQLSVKSRGAYTMEDGEENFDNSWRDAGHQKIEIYSEIHGNDDDNVIKGFGQVRINNGNSSKSHQWADIIDGGAGDDIIYGGAGDDILYGGLGNDVLYGGDHDDHLEGGEGDDLLYGGEGKDTLIGGEGNDWLFSGPLKDNEGDVMTGGAGADTFVIGEVEEPETHTETMDWGNMILNLGANAAGELLYANYPTSLPGQALSRKVIPMTLDLLRNIIGKDSETASPPKAAYAEVTDFDPTEDVVIIPLNAEGKPNIFISLDSNGHNFLTIKSDSENSTDIIATISWADVEEIFGVTDASLMSEAAKQGLARSLLQTMLIIGPDGVTIGQDQTPVEFELQHLGGLGSSRFLIFGAYGGHTLIGMESQDFLYGTVYDDVLYGYTPDNYTGSAYAPELAQDDQLYGFDGDDLFFGGGGNNHLFGGEGSDTASYEHANRGIQVDMSQKVWDGDNGGWYYVVNNGHARVMHIDGQDVDVIGYDKNYSIENITGSAHNDVIHGDELDNVLRSGAGDDELAGGDGADVFVLEGGQNTITDFDAGEGDVIEVQARAYGINTLDDLAYFGPGDDGLARLVVKSTGEIVAVLEDMHGKQFDMESQVKLSLEVFSGIDAVDRIIEGNDNANVLIADGDYNTLVGNDGTDVFVLDGGNFHHIVDFDLAAGETIRINGEAYGVTSLDDLRFEYINETAFKIITNNGHEFAGVQHAEPGLKINDLADIVDLY